MSRIFRTFSHMLKVHLAQRLHVHILSRAPLRAGDVFQPGRSQAETGLTIGKGPDDPGPSSNFLHQPLQRIASLLRRQPSHALFVVSAGPVPQRLRTDTGEIHGFFPCLFAFQRRRDLSIATPLIILLAFAVNRLNSSALRSVLVICSAADLVILFM